MGKLKILPISIRISERDLSVFTGVLLTCDGPLFTESSGYAPLFDSVDSVESTPTSSD